MRILVIDVGGTNLKVSGTTVRTPVKIPSGRGMSAVGMIEAVRRATAGWVYDVVSIGYPGPVVNGRPAAEPKNLAPGWVGFDFQKALGKPVRIINDAAMQALGGYQGARMLFLGLGTGLGSALVAEGVVFPLELAHLPYRDGKTFEDYLGIRGSKRLGRKRWRKHVAKVVAILRHAMQAEHVLLGGGEAQRLKVLPEGARLGTNADARKGGLHLWDEARTPRAR
jgi:polyphosphate glucokinase